MNVNILNWISGLVKASVLKGFKEALEELEIQEEPGAESLAAIKGRVNALPAPSTNGEEKAARSRK